MVNPRYEDVKIVVVNEEFSWNSVPQLGMTLINKKFLLTMEYERNVNGSPLCT